MNDTLLLIISFVFTVFIIIFFVCVLPSTVLVIIPLFVGFFASGCLIAECSYRICKYLGKKLFKED